jgi:hypothetical protein
MIINFLALIGLLTISLVIGAYVLVSPATHALTWLKDRFIES